MFKILTLVFSLMAGSVYAQTVDQGVQSTITNQLNAFEAQDFETAFSFASPNIKRIFGTTSNFETMVKRGYPMVVKNLSVKFLESRQIGGRIWQKVLIQDGLGVFHTLDYQMIETSDGWQINGVQLLPTPDIGA